MLEFNCNRSTVDRFQICNKVCHCNMLSHSFHNACSSDGIWVALVNAILMEIQFRHNSEISKVTLDIWTYIINNLKNYVSEVHCKCIYILYSRQLKLDKNNFWEIFWPKDMNTLINEKLQKPPICVSVMVSKHCIFAMSGRISTRF